MLSKSLQFPRLAAPLGRRALQMTSIKGGGHDHPEYWWGPERNNGREVVGYGVNGEENYIDRMDFWYPAIRFRKDDDIILPIRQKELGDWKNLSVEEKKLLYRYAYRQTLAEFEAPTGYWKWVLTCFLFVGSFPFLYMSFMKKYVFTPLPPTLQNEWKEMVNERRLVLEKGQFIGPAKYFDYEKNQWKP